MQVHRTFTGDANIRPGLSMDPQPPDAGSQRASSTAVPAKQPATMQTASMQSASMQSAFNMGSGAAPISPSKKRAHRDLKMRQTAASSPSIQPAKANPFSPYGVHSSSSNQPSKLSAQRSPGKAQPSPRRIKVSLKVPSSAQGMNIDSGSAPPNTGSGVSSTAAAPNAAEGLSSSHATAAQPSNAPFPAGIAGIGTGFSQTAMPANPFTNSHATSASFAFRPAVSSASLHPMASSANPGSPDLGARPNRSASGAAASPAAVTPPSFRFGSYHQTNAGASSPQVPFQGFAATQRATGAPSATFASFQPGMQSKPFVFTVMYNCIVVSLLAVLPCLRDHSYYRHPLFTFCKALLVSLGWNGGSACVGLIWQSHGSHISHW